MDQRIKLIEFDEENHKYTFEGRELYGVTGAIGKLMNKSFPDTDTVKIATMLGTTVHKEVENYYNNNGILSTESAKWVVKNLAEFAQSCGDVVKNVECEVMVSDFTATASKVDVVMHTDSGAYLFDIKTTSHFDRQYCSLQLAVYEKLYKECYDENVLGTFVLGTKSERRFRILPQKKEAVEKILNMNKAKAF